MADGRPKLPSAVEAILQKHEREREELAETHFPRNEARAPASWEREAKPAYLNAVAESEVQARREIFMYFAENPTEWKSEFGNIRPLIAEAPTVRFPWGDPTESS